MNPLKAIGNLLKPKIFDPTATLEVDKIGWHKMGSGGTYDFYKQNTYDNAYPSIKAIANSFLMIEPYTIDAEGTPVASNALDRVYTPNTSMSAADFREALAVMTLVHKKVYIRVHQSGTERITPSNITGFTFLESVFEIDVNDKRYYQLPTGEKLGTNEVMELKNINPFDLGQGYSPTEAARKWIQLDDYVATYQSGFFQNGAVPAGQFIITARTVSEFNDIVDKMQAMHRGAGKNNNVTYAHRAVDSTGKAQEANIEWVPFNTTNKDMALKDLFDQANKKIDSAYGVPASIRGVNSNNTYASVRVDEVIFTKYVVNPIAMKIWSKFTHELNRITGGLGVAFTYDLDIPEVADEEKVKAEAKNAELTLIARGLELGFTLETIVDSFKLNQAYKDLVPTSSTTTSSAQDISSRVTAATALIRSGFQATAALTAVGLDPIEHTGFLPITLKTDEVPVGEAAVGDTTTPTTTETTTTPEVENEAIDDKPQVATPEELNDTPETTKKELTPQIRKKYEKELAVILKAQAQKQIDRAVAEVSEKGLSSLNTSSKKIEPNKEELIEFTTTMLTSVMGLVELEGEAQRKVAMQLMLDAGINVGDLPEFSLTPAQKKSYQTYLKKVGTSYTTTTTDNLRKILQNGYEAGLPASDLKKQLRNYINEDWRIKRITSTEVNRAGTQASVDSMINISKEADIRFDKVWTHKGGDDPCDYCFGMIGNTIPVDEAYVPLGGTVSGRDGSTYVNDFYDVSSGSLHPQCHCLSMFKVRR